MTQVHVTREYGSDFVATVLLIDSANDPVTGKTGADAYVALHDATTGVSAPAFTFTELDSANNPGWYSLSVAASDLNDSEVAQSLVLHPVVALDFVPVLFTMNNTPLGWHTFFVAFQEVFERLKTMAGLVGVR